MTKTTKRLVIALAASVTLNLFLGGFLTARAVMGRPHDMHHAGPGPLPEGIGLQKDKNSGPEEDQKGQERINQGAKSGETHGISYLKLTIK